MEVRRGIGAAVASAVLFSSLLLASAALSVSADRLAGYASLADDESSLRIDALLLQGAVALAVLDAVQSAASSRTFSCPVADADLGRAIAGVQVVATSEGLMAEANVSDSSSDPRSITPLLAGPFGGWSTTGLNLTVQMTVDGSDSSGLVTYNYSGSQRLHLPFDPSETGGFCLRALSSLEREVESIQPPTCNSTLIESLTAGTVISLRQQGVDMGLSVEATFGPSPDSACSLELGVTVGEAGVQGPAGPFTWKVGSSVLMQLNQSSPSRP